MRLKTLGRIATRQPGKLPAAALRYAQQHPLQAGLVGAAGLGLLNPFGGGETQPSVPSGQELKSLTRRTTTDAEGNVATVVTEQLEPGAAPMPTSGGGGFGLGHLIGLAALGSGGYYLAKNRAAIAQRMNQPAQTYNIPGPPTAATPTTTDVAMAAETIADNFRASEATVPVAAQTMSRQTAPTMTDRQRLYEAHKSQFANMQAAGVDSRDASRELKRVLGVPTLGYVGSRNQTQAARGQLTPDQVYANAHMINAYSMQVENAKRNQRGAILRDPAIMASAMQTSAQTAATVNMPQPIDLYYPGARHSPQTKILTAQKQRAGLAPERAAQEAMEQKAEIAQRYGGVWQGGRLYGIE